VDRFAQTDTLVVEDARLLEVDERAGRARVTVVVLETFRVSGTRRYRGSWDAVRPLDTWLLDQPDLHAD
jgi:hypothetical protein